MAYIVGVGRSGSTVVDLAIGTTPSSLSTGELTWYPRLIENRERAQLSRAMAFCSCGSPIESCPLWSSVHRELSSRVDLTEFRRTTDVFEKRTTVPLILGGFLLGSSRLHQHAQTVSAVVRTAATHARARTIVDSTKLLSRGLVYLIMNDPAVEVRFIHVVRDGIPHLESRIARWDPGRDEPTPSESVLLAEIRGTFDWMYQNVIASLAGMVLRDRYLRIRYEDFVTHPGLTMERIGRFLGVDVREVSGRLTSGENLAPGHAIAGNRMKFRPVLRRDAAEGQHPVGPTHRFLFFRFVAGWLQKAYGYRPSGGVATSQDGKG